MIKINALCLDTDSNELVSYDSVSSEYKPILTTIKGRITALESLTEGHTVSINALANLSDLQTTVTEITQQIESLDIDALSEIQENHQAILDMTEYLQNNSERIDAIWNSEDPHGSSTELHVNNTMKTSWNGAVTDVATLKGEMDAVETDVADHETRLQTLEGQFVEVVNPTATVILASNAVLTNTGNSIMNFPLVDALKATDFRLKIFTISGTTRSSCTDVIDFSPFENSSVEGCNQTLRFMVVTTPRITTYLDLGLHLFKVTPELIRIQLISCIQTEFDPNSEFTAPSYDRVSPFAISYQGFSYWKELEVTS